MILAKERDPRFITVRRGGTLSDPDHHLLAIRAADCAQHELHHFEQVRPGDDRPRQAIGHMSSATVSSITTWHRQSIG